MDEARIEIVLADDHALVRDGIRLLLEAEPDLHVLAEAGDSDTAHRLVAQHRPAILILDLTMPGTPVLELLPRLREELPDTQLIVLTMHADTSFARSVFAAGGRAYVVKHSAGAELVAAVRAVISGDTYVTPELAASLAAEPAEPGPPDRLSPREQEVLSLIALGYMNPEIADQLVLSVRTVETHRSNIQRKTGCSTRAELVAYALEKRIVER